MFEPIASNQQLWHHVMQDPSHLMPVVNFFILVGVVIFQIWMSKQVLRNRTRMNEMEVDQSKRSQAGLGKILDVLDDPERFGFLQKGMRPPHHKEE